MPIDLKREDCFTRIFEIYFNRLKFVDKAFLDAEKVHKVVGINY